MDETTRWLVGIIVILSTGWGAHVMRRLGNHDKDIRTLGERLVEVERLRAATELETATILARLEAKVEQLIELFKATKQIHT